MSEFHRGLVQFGYVVDRNVLMEHRAVDGRADRRPALIADLVRRRMAVIVTDATLLAQEIKATTQTIPIVFLAGGDLSSLDSSRVSIGPAATSPA
jgi:putative ABC transport system substrate-binding protein